MDGQAGDTAHILLVEDDPMMQVIVRHGLSGLEEQKEVVMASSGAEALAAAKATTPTLVLLDYMLPDMSGVEVLEGLRAEAATARTPVIFLTGAASSLDAEMLARLHVSGVINKPFDPETLLAQIEAALRTRTNSTTASLPSIDELRDAFLAQGAEASATLLVELEGGSFDNDRARGLAHLWAGRGGTLGFAPASELARELESLLELPDPPAGEVRGTLTAIGDYFESGPQPLDVAANTSSDDVTIAADAIGGTLAGKRIALIAFADSEEESLRRALEGADAFHRSLGVDECERLDDFDLLIARLDHDATTLLEADHPVHRDGTPCVFIGPRGLLARAARGTRHDFVVAPWGADEVLLRAHRLLAIGPSLREAPTPSRERPLVLIADDDSAITTLIAATLGAEDIDCRVAANGGQALEMIGGERPDALVLDVNMPGVDGFEVLSQVKSDPATREILVLMLTARQRETDIIRGFRLGADEYMIKPFNPTELLARLSRLLRANR